MGRGRPRKPGTAEEKAIARRARVRNNVRALRERRKREAARLHTNEHDGLNKLRDEQIDNDDHDTSVSSNTVTSHNSTGQIISRRLRTPLNAGTNNAIVRSSGALVLTSSRKGAGASLPYSVDSRSPYASALLATVREQFLPDSVYLPPAIDSTEGKPWESEQFLWTPCAFWVTSAFTKASNQDTSLLKTSLLAIGMLMKSVQHQDKSLRVASLEMYRRSLQGIRKSLEPLIEGRPERPKDTVALYLSCHAAAMFELIENADLSATMYHLRGVSRLICHLGDGRDEDGQSMAWLLLQDYRFAEMGLCLKFRYISFSSIKRRQFENATIGNTGLVGRATSAHGYGSHNMLVILTDIADDISAIMVQLDNWKMQPTRVDVPIKLRRLLQKLDQIWNDFPLLQKQLISRYGKDFVYRDNDNTDPDDKSFKFKTFDIGAAWCYYLMIQIYSLETSIEVTTLLLKLIDDLSNILSPPESKHSGQSDESNVESIDESVNYDKLQELRRLHRSVCVQLTHCLQYFLQTDKGITGQALAIFPLDTAICMLEVEHSRLTTDLQNASAADQDTQSIATILKSISMVIGARKYCQGMQDRAREFGLPSFHTAGSSSFQGSRDSGQEPPRYN